VSKHHNAGTSKRWNIIVREHHSARTS